MLVIDRSYFIEYNIWVYMIDYEVYMTLLQKVHAFLNSHTYFHNTLFEYVVSLGIFFGIFILITLIIKFGVSRLVKLEVSLKNSFAVLLIESFRVRLIYITYAFAFYGAFSYLKTPKVFDKYIDRAVMVYISIIIILAITDILRDYNKVELSKNEHSKVIPSGLVTIFKIAVWICGILFILSNLGYDVSTFITGLGIGGVAIALAAQNIVGDLFNYFVILFDKPFKKGDFIEFDVVGGTVEKVGIKSTKIRSKTGELLSISNSDLIKNTIHNYAATEKRRRQSVIGIVYETPPEKVRKVPEILKQALESVPNVEIVRIYFRDFNSSSLDFEVVYYVHYPTYKEVVECVQDINLAILDAFAREKIDFAYPTQRLITQLFNMDNKQDEK